MPSKRSRYLVLFLVAAAVVALTATGCGSALSKAKKSIANAEIKKLPFDLDNKGQPERGTTHTYTLARPNNGNAEAIIEVHVPAALQDATVSFSCTSGCSDYEKNSFLPFKLSTVDPDTKDTVNETYSGSRHELFFPGHTYKVWLTSKEPGAKPVDTGCTITVPEK